jgi:hypothetical protein
LSAPHGTRSSGGGKARLVTKEDKDGRAVMFMLERIKNKSLQQIAKDYNCSIATVVHYLAYARKHDLVVNQARLIIGENLVPLALAVYEAQLLDGNLQAAQDILFGAGVLQKTSNVKHQPAGDDDLDSFRNSYFKAVENVKAVTSAPPIEVAPQLVHDHDDGEGQQPAAEPEQD